MTINITVEPDSNYPAAGMANRLYATVLQQAFSSFDVENKYVRKQYLSGDCDENEIISLLYKNDYILFYKSMAKTYESEAYYFRKNNSFVNFYFSKKDDNKVSGGITFYNAIVNGNAEQEKEVEEFISLFKNLIKEEEKVTVEKVYMFCQGNGGPYISDIGKDYIPLVRENYCDETLDAYDKVVKEFDNDNGKGNIAIFRGNPGCGKTYMIRSLVGDLKKCACVYLPPMMLSSLSAPVLLTKLHDFSRQQNDKNIVLLLEDADQILAPRMSDNINDVSSLLNLADGILGKILRIRILATTNQKKQNFDSAILRPGRLLVNNEVTKLNLHKCIDILNRELNTDYQKKDFSDIKDKYSLAEVYSLTKEEKENPGIVESTLQSLKTNSNGNTFYSKVGF